MEIMFSYNTHLHRYPEMQERWGQIMLGSAPQDQLFKMNGNELISWKDELNGKQAKEAATEA